MTEEPFMQAVRDRDGHHPARIYPLANPPDEADFLGTRKLYARAHHIPLERAVLVPDGPHGEHDEPAADPDPSSTP